MTRYEEIVSRCEHCPNIDKCIDALGDAIWQTNILTPEDINCEYFSRLGVAVKEYVQDKIYEMLTKSLEDNQ